MDGKIFGYPPPDSKVSPNYGISFPELYRTYLEALRSNDTFFSSPSLWTAKDVESHIQETNKIMLQIINVCNTDYSLTVADFSDLNEWIGLLINSCYSAGKLFDSSLLSNRNFRTPANAKIIEEAVKPFIDSDASLSFETADKLISDMSATLQSYSKLLKNSELYNLACLTGKYSSNTPSLYQVSQDLTEFRKFATITDLLDLSYSGFAVAGITLYQLSVISAKGPSTEVDTINQNPEQKANQKASAFSKAMEISSFLLSIEHGITFLVHTWINHSKGSTPKSKVASTVVKSSK